MIKIQTSRESLNTGLDTGEGKSSDLENISEKITQNEAVYLKERPINPPPQ